MEIALGGYGILYYSIPVACGAKIIKPQNIRVSINNSVVKEMRNYDGISGFRYWDPKGWRSFVTQYIKPLHRSAAILRELGDYLVKIAEPSNTLADIKREDSEALQFMLGGIKEDGTYSENSLAKLVRYSLGVYIVPTAFITLAVEEGKDVYESIEVKVKETKFWEFLVNLEEQSEKILSCVGEECDEIEKKEIDEIIEKPEKLLKIIGDLYVKCLQVSANSNYYTFFALSTENLPFNYMKKLYPKIGENIGTLQEFLGLEKKVFEPEGLKGKGLEDYTIWGHSYDGLCNLLSRLNEEIWKNFSSNEDSEIKEVLSYVTNQIPDLKREYYEKAEKELKKIGWRFPEYLRTWSECYDILDGMVMDRHSEPRSFLQVINDLAPGIFLKVVKVSIHMKNICVEKISPEE
jgi:tetratricopeptide (TPR) repeat protein